jgi:hypothetical protein
MKEVLSTIPANFSRVKELATKDGYNRFRVAVIVLDKPNFIKTIA